jgi:hypothetical protein
MPPHPYPGAHNDVSAGFDNPALSTYKRMMMLVI